MTEGDKALTSREPAAGRAASSSEEDLEALWNTSRDADQAEDPAGGRTGADHHIPTSEGVGHEDQVELRS
jgi:hypothetical protein